MKSAFLIVDAQNGVFAPNNPPYLSEYIISNIQKLLNYAKSSTIDVIFIQHEIPSLLDPGSDAWQIFAELDIEDCNYRIRKKTPDSFYDTNLNHHLNDKEIEHLFVCGYSTEFCIDRTVSSAANKGFKVTLIEDAHTTHDKPHLAAPAIIAHHSFTLSKHPNITLQSTATVVLDQPIAE